MRSKKLIALILGTTFTLLGFMGQIPFAFANTASSSARAFVVWTNTQWILVNYIPVPCPYPAVGRLDVSCSIDWSPNWGYTITAGSWSATGTYTGNSIPGLPALYATYFQMTVHAYATPLRGSYDRTYFWSYPPPDTSLSAVYFSYNMPGSFGVRCMSAELTVTWHVHMTSFPYGTVEATISTTAYAP